MRLFKNIKGERIDPIAHTLKIMKVINVQIHVGSDSQNVGKKQDMRLSSLSDTVVEEHYILSKKSKPY